MNSSNLPHQTITIQDALKVVVAGCNLTTAQATDVFSAIMSGAVTDAQIGAFIVALCMKGESVEEIIGAASVMREKATQIVPDSLDFVVDTCGTGGDGQNTFNISTATAFVAAGAGATVAKHGNRSVSSKCGSADVLEALGVNISLTSQQMKECIDKVGIGFLFAPTLHIAMKYAIRARKEIGLRTIFNILGPLTNPAFAPNQILGVFSADLTEPLAHVLKSMGTRKAYVVHGLDSLDEISIAAATRVSEINNSSVTTYDISPEDFGIRRASLRDIAGGDAQENAAILRSVLNGEKGPYRDIVILNSAFAIAASGLTETPQLGIHAATESIDSGAALDKLEKLCRFTTSCLKEEPNSTIH